MVLRAARTGDFLAAAAGRDGLPALLAGSRVRDDAARERVDFAAARRDARLVAVLGLAMRRCLAGANSGSGLVKDCWHSVNRNGLGRCGFIARPKRCCWPMIGTDRSSKARLYSLTRKAN